MGDDLTVDPSDSLPVLERVNWSFSSPFTVGRSGAELFDPRKHHWFPATFIPEIPYTVIDVLTHRGATVYDPFSGIGTTATQAYLLGRRPFGTDISRVAVRLSRSLLQLLVARDRYDELWSNIAVGLDGYSSSTDYTSVLEDTAVDTRLVDWYHPQTLNELAFLTKLWRQHKADSNHLVQAVLFVAISATLKAVSAQDRGWGCVADNVKPSDEQMQEYRNALDRLERNARTLLRDLASATNSDAYVRPLPVESPNKRIFHADARNTPDIPPESVDLVITSPPYPEMTDYSYSQRLTYYWLGMNPKKDVNPEIGARRKRSRKTSIQDYTAELKEAIHEVASKVTSGGYVCFVMPVFFGDNLSDKNRRRKQAISQSTTELLQLGFEDVADIDRNLPKRRRHHNQKWTSLERERIHIYRKIS